MIPHKICQNLSKEANKAFILYFQNKEIEIDNSNVITLNYLSNKFEINFLKNKTDNYIQNHSQELIDEFLNQEEIKTNTKYEEILSKHLNEFFDDDRLLNLPKATLYRILSRYNELKNFDTTDEQRFLDEYKLIDFLIKNINDNDVEASILFDIVNLWNKGILYLNEKIEEQKSKSQKIKLQKALLHSPRYIFDYIKCQEETNKAYREKIKNIHKEITDLKSFYEEQFKTLKIQLEEKHQEDIRQVIENSKEVYEKQEEHFQILDQQLKDQEIQNKHDITNIIEKENKERIKQNKIIKEMTKSIYNIGISEYFPKEKISIFNCLNGESQSFLIAGLNEKHENKIFEYMKELLYYFSKEQIKANYKFNTKNYIDVKTNNDNDIFHNQININSIIISKNTLEMLYENGSIESNKFINIVKKYEISEAYLRYPLTKYQEICNDVLKII